MLLYNPNFDETYFVTRFLAGLKEDICSGIVLHRPPDVDTVSALALLQEAELSHCKARPQGKDGFRTLFKTTIEKVKLGEGEKHKQQPLVTETEDRLATLKNFRRKNGPCFKCGNKWGKDHKCPPQVALHVIEELLDALEDEGLDSKDPDPEIMEETVMVVGHSEHIDQIRRKTMKLCGNIGKHDVLILVDSGSVASFISTRLAEHLQLFLVPCQPTMFVVADGSPMTCSRQIQSMHWSVGAHSFSSPVGILPLKCFDMIVGEDWLEECSPMWVHWSKKNMKITYMGKRIELHGVQQQMSHCAPISASCLQSLIIREAVLHCLQFKWCSPQEQHLVEPMEVLVHFISMDSSGELSHQIKSLLDSYADLF